MNSNTHVLKQDTSQGTSYTGKILSLYREGYVERKALFGVEGMEIRVTMIIDLQEGYESPEREKEVIVI